VAAVADALAETDRNPLDGLTAAEAIEPRGQERIVGWCSSAVTPSRVAADLRRCSVTALATSVWPTWR
jgi:hypothetical protein